jgi:hypothetical protein
MFKKIQASLTFRKNTPGVPLTTIKNMAEYKGQLYTFQYNSFGTKQRSARNKDARPLLLLAYRAGDKVWKAKNGKKYIYGFNLNYLPPRRRLRVIDKLQEIFAENPGVTFTYKSIRNHLNLPSTTEDSIFRKYDIRGSKLRYLKQVNLNTYRDYLTESLS